MSEETRALRREFSKRERGRGKRYPAELKRRVVDWAVPQRSAGATWAQLARQLGFKGETLRRWYVAAGRGSGPRQAIRSLVPVRVADPAARTVSVVSPTGYRVDGLSLPEAAAVLRAVG